MTTDQHAANNPPAALDADALLQASRRVDWRFLLPDPNLGRVAYLGPRRGALLDSLLLASVYVELLGERQASLGLVASPAETISMASYGAAEQPALVRSRPLPPRLSPEAEAAHRAYVTKLGPKPLWLRLFSFASE